MSLYLRLAAASLLAASSATHAAWHEASSKHFIIYADQKPEQLKRYAERLEQFDLAVRALRKMHNPDVAPSARVTIYMVRNEDQVRKIGNASGSLMAGFYKARSSGSIAVVPAYTDSIGSGFTADTVFFHEYAHHLMFEQLNQAVPAWFVEGFAEFFSTARFEQDGSISIGKSPGFRADGVFSQEGITYKDLLAGNYSAKRDYYETQSIYGRGWALNHFLTFTPARNGQLADYLTRLGRGEASAIAAESAFGDLRQLDQEIRRYVTKSRLPALRLAYDKAAIGQVNIRPLQVGEAAIIPVRVQSKAGVNDKSAPGILAKAREVGKLYPDDALVAVSIAEAALDARDIDGSIIAATRATQLDPRSVEAKLFRGRALLARASTGKNRDVDVKAAREEFLAANKLEPEHPEPLRAYYESFFIAGDAPNKNAAAALHYAAVLAPADNSLRWMSAQQYLVDGDGAKARTDLSMLAFDPHGGNVGVSAKEALDLIEAGKTEQALEVLQKGPGQEAPAEK